MTTSTERQRRLRARRKERGKCTRCGRVRVSNGKLQCPPCREYRAAMYRQRRVTKKRYMCSNCSEVGHNKSTCEYQDPYDDLS